MLLKSVLVRKMIPSKKRAVRLLCILGLSAVLGCCYSTMKVEFPSHKLLHDIPIVLQLMKGFDEFFMRFATGGRDVKRCEFEESMTTLNREFYVPYMSMMSLRNGNNEHVCGGSLISPTVGLTAAHCFDPNYTDTLPETVDIGRLKRTGRCELRFASRTIRNYTVHHSYSQLTHLDNDIALVYLHAPTNSPAATLATNDDCFESPEGCNLRILGFGKLDYNKGLADTLQLVEPPVLSKANCQEHRSAQIITNSMLCAGNLTHGGISSCPGDSGGPAFVFEENMFKQVGIVSWSNGCGDADTPEVLTSIPKLLSWIEEHLHDFG